MMRMTESQFELAVFPGNVRMRNEVVAELEPIPMLKMGLDHVDVMRSVPVHVTFDEPGIEWRGIITPRWPPEIVIPLRFQDGGMSLK